MQLQTLAFLNLFVIIFSISVNANNIARYDGTLTSVNLKDTFVFKEPSASDIKSLCDCVAIKEKLSGETAEHYDYAWERRLMVLAGTSIETDGFDVAAKKLRSFWEKYKTKFTCQSSKPKITNFIKIRKSLK